MSRLPESFLDELRARVPLVDVVRRRVPKLERKGSDWVCCCPLHNEKTPSFRVYADQHFHCYGCQKGGDVISFVMKTERKEFREAVEQLAKEAGLEVPTTPEQRAEDGRRNAVLWEVERAHDCYVSALWGGIPGQTAMEYLLARGLTPATISAAGLGWADGKAWPHFDARLAVAAGLAPEDTARPLLFRRVTFPILDRRGRTVAFTARTLDDKVQPKYLNTYNSEFFTKSEALYVTPRRMIETDDVYLDEGPLDALALYQAGACSAALMSASLSPAHLEEVWRTGAKPILCLDGDAAGRRATLRAIGVALPLLTPHRTFRVALLPAGEDPDSLLRGRSAEEALGIIRDATMPVERALYELLRPTADVGAAGRARHLEDVLQRLKTVTHRDLRYEFIRDIKDLHFRQRRGRAPAPVVLVNGEAEAARAMTAAVLRHPWIMSNVHTHWEQVPFPAPLAAVRGSAIAVYADDARFPDDFIDVVDRRSPGLVSAVLGDEPLPLPRFARAEATDAEAEAGFWHCFDVLNRGAVDAEIEATREALREHPNPLLERKLVALTVARIRRGR